MKLKIIFLPLSIMIAVAGYIWFSQPQIEKNKENKTILAGRQEELKKLENSVASIEGAYSDYSSLRTGVKSLVENILPDDQNDDDLVGEINRSAVRSGVSVTAIDISEEKKAVDYQCLNAAQPGSAGGGESCEAGVDRFKVTLQVMGKYLQMKEFIKRLDAHNRMILPMGITIDQESLNNRQGVEEGEERNEEQLVRADLSFVVFAKKNRAQQSLSQISTLDPALKSLITEGLKNNLVEEVEEIVTGDLFIPVKVSGQIGKEDPFEN